MKITYLALFCFTAFSVLAADEAPVKPAATGRKVEKPVNFIPAKADPLMGDWQGDKAGYVAQIFPTGEGKYQANLLTTFDTENNVVTVLQGTASDKGVTFAGNGWTGEIKDSHFTGKNGANSFDMKHITRTSPDDRREASGKYAVVLFDGQNLDAWAKKSGKRLAHGRWSGKMEAFSTVVA